MRVCVLIAICMSAVFMNGAGAAIWVSDAHDERARGGLPTADAILAGQWERRCAFYFEKTILVESRYVNPIYVPGQTLRIADYAELAFAYVQQGRFDEARQVFEKKLKMEKLTNLNASNMASICLIEGRWNEAADLLRKSIEQAPVVPYHREPFQLMLVDYMIACDANHDVARRSPTFVRPLLRQIARGEHVTASGASSTQPVDWLDHADDKALFKSSYDASNMTLDRGREALLAMIRFGDAFTPQLYAALGDVLMCRGEDALAYRAYLRAKENDHPDPAFLDAQLAAIRTRIADPESISPRRIDDERTAANKWVAAYQAYDETLLKANVPTHKIENYAAFYDIHGTGRPGGPSLVDRTLAFIRRSWQPLVVIASILTLLAMRVGQMLHKRVNDRRTAIPVASKEVNAAD